MTKLLNFPNNPILVNVAFTNAILYLCPYPEITKPNYVLFAFIRIVDDIFLSRLCNLRTEKENETILENKVEKKDNYDKYKYYLNSDKDVIYSFYSRNNKIGDNFFFNKIQDYNILKELLLASYLINSSYFPVSKKVNIYNGCFLEARSGKYANDRVYAAIGSVKPVYNKAYSNIPIFVIFTLISLTLIFFIANIIISDLLAPVKQLIDGAKSASNGNYSFRTNFDRGDEPSELCSSFNKMMKSLEDKQLMNRMVSKIALSVTANEYDIASKKIDAVILYITVPNFDEIMKNTPSFELFTRLKKQIAIISEIVLKAGGDIDKIMGEKLLVAFRLGKKPLREVAISACKAAIEIERNNQLDYKVSIGINCGQVISGFLGVGNKRDFTIIGDPVNVAARIAVFAEKLDSERCMISDNLYILISDSLNVLEYGKVELKGKSQLLKVYKLV